MEAILKLEELEKLDINYDRDRDVLYISFGPPADDDAELLDSDIIIRYRGERARNSGARFFAEI
ncbi:Protein of unknown function (DUF2283) [Methanophagales archaeon]|nr:Protein of unknown function (DUF2283) [Methanophagales archaeon]